MRRQILVNALGDSKYRVTVEEVRSKSVHEILIEPKELERYGQGANAERLLLASFQFLLEREAKESILPRFRLSEIERYFPDYAKEIRRLL